MQTTQEHTWRDAVLADLEARGYSAADRLALEALYHSGQPIQAAVEALLASPTPVVWTQAEHDQEIARIVARYAPGSGTIAS